jgi:hypothetical protein
LFAGCIHIKRIKEKIRVTIEIKNINTRPEHDPYANIAGIVSRTVFWLDPESRECSVEQEYRTNSTSIERWHGRELYWFVADHPSETAMRQWIEDSMELLEEICDGYSCEWDGNNHVGCLSDAARQCQEDIERELESGQLGNYYEVYSVEDWVNVAKNDIHADMSDKELEELASNWEPDESTVLLGRYTILEYITEIRRDLR